MDMKYVDMYTMFRENHEAWRFFNSLPTNVRDEISTRAHNINSYTGLRNCADGLLHE